MKLDDVGNSGKSQPQGPQWQAPDEHNISPALASRRFFMHSEVAERTLHRQGVVLPDPFDKHQGCLSLTKQEMLDT
jgi:hypothetical protein